MRGNPAGESFGAEFADHDAPLLRTSEVAALLSVSERTVTSWARAGRIRCVRMPGGHWRFPRTSVLDLLGHTKEGAS